MALSEILAMELSDEFLLAMPQPSKIQSRTGLEEFVLGLFLKLFDTNLKPLN
jgi:hypothetical protein